MQSFRIGKTLKIRWAILSGGAPEPLAGRDLTLEISSGNRVRTILPFVADGNVAVFYYQGRDQRFSGTYTVTMWENYAKEGQTVVDRCDAFALVPSSCEETRTTAADLAEGELEIEPSELEIGVPGMSAYELYIRHNPDSELTEEEYAEAPVQAAGAALAAVEQIEETETEVKQAEQLRDQAEQGRAASEQARATAEQARVTAEQQRALAEQTRVTNEASRQTAETGRQVAETKREENTSEAIRNCESATQKAEDEAARVRTLADNPPKIVEVDGVRYWASWNEATGQYVVSENRADVGDAVLFSPQGLNAEQRAQVQTNIGVKSAVDVIGAGEAQAIPMDVAKDGKYRYLDGREFDSSVYFISNPFSVKRGDIIIGKLNASENTSALSQVDSNNNFIKLLLGGKGADMSMHYVVTQDMQVSFSANKTSFSLALIPCELVKSIAEPGGGYLQKFAETIGIVFNNETGFYEYAGLTDLTEVDIIKSIFFHTSIGYNFDLSYLYANLPSICPRLFLPIASYNTVFGPSLLMYNGSDAESIMLTYNSYVKFSSGTHMHMFRGCRKLKYINYGSYIDVSLVTIASYLNLFPEDCPVQYIKLKGLKVDMDFGKCPNIRVDDNTDSDLGFLIENAANTSPITVTLHPDAYAKVPQSLIEKATAKQISIASV